MVISAQTIRQWLTRFVTELATYGADIDRLAVKTRSPHREGKALYLAFGAADRACQRLGENADASWVIQTIAHALHANALSPGAVAAAHIFTICAREVNYPVIRPVEFQALIKALRDQLPACLLPSPAAHPRLAPLCDLGQLADLDDPHPDIDLILSLIYIQFLEQLAEEADPTLAALTLLAASLRTDKSLTESALWEMDTPQPAPPAGDAPMQTALFGQPVPYPGAVGDGSKGTAKRGQRGSKSSRSRATTPPVSARAQLYADLFAVGATAAAASPPVLPEVATVVSFGATTPGSDEVRNRFGKVPVIGACLTDDFGFATWTVAAANLPVQTQPRDKVLILRAGQILASTPSAMTQAKVVTLQPQAVNLLTPTVLVVGQHGGWEQEFVSNGANVSIGFPPATLELILDYLAPQVLIPTDAAAGEYCHGIVGILTAPSTDLITAILTTIATTQPLPGNLTAPILREVLAAKVAHVHRNATTIELEQLAEIRSWGELSEVYIVRTPTTDPLDLGRIATEVYTHSRSAHLVTMTSVHPGPTLVGALPDSGTHLAQTPETLTTGARHVAAPPAPPDGDGGQAGIVLNVADRFGGRERG